MTNDDDRQPATAVDNEATHRRQYTGEPVETEDGWVLPQQMATGNDNIIGDSH